MPIKTNYFLVVVPLILGIAIHACKQNASEPSDIIPGLKSTEHTISETQVLDSVNSGTVRVVSLNETRKITCPGFVEVPPNNKAIITVPQEGLISTILVTSGQYVNKGTPVATLSNPAYIRLQEKFLSVKSELDYYKEEFKRQGQLTIEKAAPMKKMQQAEVDYLSREARFLSLKKQLQMLNIPVENVSYENILSTITVNAPISGYITALESQPGKLIRPGDAICEIYNTHYLFLELQVPQQYLQKIKKTESIMFSVVGDTSMLYKAIVTEIGEIIDPKTRTVPAYASITKKLTELKPNMQVQAILDDISYKIHLIPTSAVFQEKGNFYIMVQTKADIKKIEITARPYNKDYMKIINPTEQVLYHPVIMPDVK